MSPARKQILVNGAVVLLWINVAVWLIEVICHDRNADTDLGLLIVSAAVALTTTAIKMNDRRIAKLEQACCALTRLVLESDEADHERRRHLSSVA